MAKERSWKRRSGNDLIRSILNEVVAVVIRADIKRGHPLGDRADDIMQNDANDS